MIAQKAGVEACLVLTISVCMSGAYQMPDGVMHPADGII